MHRLLFTICIACLFLSCNDDNTVDPLSQPPYDKISDSISKAPNDADLYFRRGGLLYSNNQPVFAERDLRKAWELQPKEEYAVGITTLLKEKNPDSAIFFLQNALKKLPGNVFLQIELIKDYKDKKRFDEALAICEDVLSQYPNAVDALLLKAEILKEQNKNPQALATLEKAYVFAPGDVELVHELAFEYAEAKNPKAISLADSLIKADTDKSHAEPYYFKGVYYSNTGNATEAVKQFDEAIRHNYNFMNAYINKGIIFFDRKKYEDAYKTFKLANTVAPDEADPYYWMARTQEAIGNKTEAKTNYLRAYSLDKTMTEAKEAADRL
jgi:tetratricopeptide (TPR) repeat protein